MRSSSALFNRNLTSGSAATFLLLIALTMSGDAAPAERTQANSLTGDIAVAAARDGEGLQTELITITSTGFEPTELTRPAGKFLLDVDNRSEIEDVELHLDRQEGGREKSATVRSTAPEWRGALDLRPGVYILTEANHPTWICRITITSD